MLAHLNQESLLQGATSGEVAQAPDAQEFTALQRRPHRFAQAAKLLASLGWDVQPLAGKVAREGLYEQADCKLHCQTCAAEVGLWPFDDGEGMHLDGVEKKGK